MDRHRTILLLLLSSVLIQIKSATWVIGGYGCGTFNQFRVVDKMPEDKEQISQLSCAIVKDSQVWKEYVRQKMENRMGTKASLSLCY